MAKKHPKIDDLVQIRFWDHSENGDDAVECTVWGEVANITPHAYTVRTWHTRDHEDNSFNNHQFNIVKSAVIKIKILRAKGTS